MRHLLNRNESVVKEWITRAPQKPATSSALNLYSRGKRIMSEGHTLYSYGKHFPLAQWCPAQNLFLINSDRISTTTSHHQYLVRRNVGVNSLEVGKALCASPASSPVAYMVRWDKLIQEANTKAMRARSRKEYYIEQVRKLTSDRTSFVHKFLQVSHCSQSNSKSV